MSLFGSARRTFANGLIDAPEGRREIVAVYESGDIFFARGRKFHAHVRDAQTLVRKTLGRAPILEEVSAAEVMAHYEAVTDSLRGGSPESHERIAVRILRDAAIARATDVKIIRTPERTAVRFGIAGQEIDHSAQISSLEGDALISFIFDARDEGAGHATKTQGEFQGFSVSDAAGRAGSGLTLPPGVLKLRCQKGFHETSREIMDHLAIRIFYRETEEMASPEALGLDPATLLALKRARDSLKGAVVIGGETGDGKSTTVISAVKRQYLEHGGMISVVTVEDPVEYKLDEPGIVQIPIRSSGDAAGRTRNYRAALMHFVRVNPHVGVVSEIRDAEAARQVLQFIETGHQVWTTIHVNSANSIPFRLIDMGIEPAEIAKPDSLGLLMKQTLVPLLCRCARRDADGFMRRSPAGCPLCRWESRGPEAGKAWAGHQRLAAPAEFVEPDDIWLGMIRARDAIGARNHWLRTKEEGGMGGVSLKRKLACMARMGAIDPGTALRKGARVSDARASDAETESVCGDWIMGLLDARAAR